MTLSGINKQLLFDSLPAYCIDDKKMTRLGGLEIDPYKIVVLDDDPTGTQTISGVPVLTVWDYEQLREKILGQSKVLFILTNTRAKMPNETAGINREIIRNLSKIEEESKIRLIIISRSDSTLRGHFPLEPNVICDNAGKQIEGCIIIPFFYEGGRFTVKDVHYLEEDENLVPVGESVFAKDKVFGYTNSNLKEWVEEKTNGEVKREQVRSISISDLRSRNSERIINTLMGLKKGDYCIVNAVSYKDINIFCEYFWTVFSKNKELIFRSAASLIPSLINQPNKKLLKRDALDLDNHPVGLVMVGSYVKKTTEQLRALTNEYPDYTVEIDVKMLIRSDCKHNEIDRVLDRIDQIIGEGCSPIVYTSRDLIAGKSHKRNLEIGKIVSKCLIEIVKKVKKPDFIIAKGGITSSDIATDALDIREAMVLGQILPGVSVWSPGKYSKYSNMPYIVFPGNVGRKEDLLNLYKRITGN